LPSWKLTISVKVPPVSMATRMGRGPKGPAGGLEERA
jgi:hypothetical protein